MWSFRAAGRTAVMAADSKEQQEEIKSRWKEGLSRVSGWKCHDKGSEV